MDTILWWLCIEEFPLCISMVSTWKFAGDPTTMVIHPIWNPCRVFFHLYDVSTVVTIPEVMGYRYNSYFWLLIICPMKIPMFYWLKPACNIRQNNGPQQMTASLGHVLKLCQHPFREGCQLSWPVGPMDPIKQRSKFEWSRFTCWFSESHRTNVTNDQKTQKRTQNPAIPTCAWRWSPCPPAPSSA